MSAAADPAVYRLVHAALRDGTITRANACETCGVTPVHGGTLHGHHEDYTKPLDVVWLCPHCHRQRHRALRMAGTTIPGLVGIREDRHIHMPPHPPPPPRPPCPDDMAHRLRVEMARAGVTSRALALALDVSEATVGNWRSGRSSPARSVRMGRLADRLGVSARWLAYGVGVRDLEAPEPRP